MEKYSLFTKLAKCTLNIALKLTFSVFLFFFVFWLHFRPLRHCLRPFLEQQFFTQKKIEQQEEMVLHFAEKIGTILTFLRFLSTNWSHALLYTVGCIKGGQLLSAVPIFTVAHVSNSAVCISQPLNNSNSLEDCKA